jgi:hypothetical protein
MLPKLHPVEKTYTEARRSLDRLILFRQQSEVKNDQLDKMISLLSEVVEISKSYGGK